ncbi:MAG TPA: hypothetical protein ENO30_06635 [Thermodesulfobium narugense]|nr:hypothetical protein [Thermodesulfobium narugense]
MNDPVVYNAFLREIKHVPLLVLDDIGAENLTDYNLEILSSILYFRYNYNLPNIITSNIGFLPTAINITNRVNNPLARNTKQHPQQQQIKKIRNQYISFHELDEEIKIDMTGRLGSVLTSRIADQYVFFVYEGKDRRIMRSNSAIIT